MADRLNKACGAAGRTVAGAAAAVNPAMIDENEALNDKFLLKLARKMGIEYLEVGVSLGLTGNTVRQLEHDHRRAVDINFHILKTWRDNVDYGKSVNDMYDQLAVVFMDIELGILHDFVRNEQAQTARAQTTVDEQLASERRPHEGEMSKVWKAIDSLRLKIPPGQGTRPKVSASRAVTATPDDSSEPNERNPGSHRRTGKAVFAERDVKKAAEPAQGETRGESKRRKLRVISLLRKHELPHLWSTVSDQVLEDGELNVSFITLSVQNVEDLTYLIASGNATNISKLNLQECRLESTDETASLLAAIVRATTVKELWLPNNDLHGRPVRALTGHVGAWTKMEILRLEYCDLGDDDVSSLTSTLSSMTSLKVLGLAGNNVTDDTARHVTEAVVKLPAVDTLSLSDNWITPAGVKSLRAMAATTPRVWLACVDWQRPPGTRAKDDDSVVRWTRLVETLEATLTLVEGRPLADRGRHWTDDVAELKRLISVYRDRLG